AIFDGDFPHKDISVLAAAYRLKVPVTVHIGIGYDIIHEHPNCDGAATGATSYKDFLQLAKVIENLEGGVIMNFGSAVMAPEVFLKALSMARNVAHQEGRCIKHFTTVVCDLHDLPDDCSKEPCKENPAYYFRPWKTMRQEQWLTAERVIISEADMKKQSRHYGQQSMKQRRSNNETIGY
ncbi:MAG: hypothetical protein HQL08_08410, partial [Nitrospirae bacterium]|nr:hypothetical protein [Nitrospirota bacterium]